MIQKYFFMFFFEHECWSLSFGPKYRLWAIENRVLNISMQKKVTMDLHIKLHYLYLVMYD